MRNARTVFLAALAAVAVAVLGLALAASAQASPVQWRVVTDGLDNPGGGVYLTNAHSGYYMGRIYRHQMFGVHDYRGSRGYGARVTDDGRVYRWGRAYGDADGCYWIGPAGNGPPGDEYLGRVDGTNRDRACSRVHMNALAERTNFGRDFNCPANAAVGPQRTTLSREAAFFHNVKWVRDGERYAAAHVAGARRAVLAAGTTVWYRYTTRDGSKAVVFARGPAGEELGWGFVDANAVNPPSMRHWTLAGSWAPEWSCGTALEAGGRDWADTVGVAHGASVHLSDDNAAAGRVLSLLGLVGGDGRTVSGDFDGDGRDEVAVYTAPYLRVYGGDGRQRGVIAFGQAGDVPVVGDWDGDGTDTVGIWRLGVFHLSDDAMAENAVVYALASRRLVLGLPGDAPLAGSWSAGQRADSPAVYRAPGFYMSVPLAARSPEPYAIAPGVVRFGAVGDLPVVGDWDNKGYDSIGVFRAGTFLLRNSNTTGEPDAVVAFGTAGDLPLAGNWDGR